MLRLSICGLIQFVTMFTLAQLDVNALTIVLSGFVAFLLPFIVVPLFFKDLIENHDEKINQN